MQTIYKNICGCFGSAPAALLCAIMYLWDGHIYLDIDAEVDEEVVYGNFSFNPKSDWRRLGRGYPLDIFLSAVHPKYGTIYWAIIHNGEIFPSFFEL